MLLAAALGSLLLGFLAAEATAAPLRVASFFGSTGSADGQFSNTTGVGGLAVNRTGAGGVEPGSVYVVDRGGNRVERFAPDPLTGAYEFRAAIGARGSEGGEFEKPQSVAVDQSSGAIYVLDGSNFRLQKLTATGAFQWAVGRNVLTGGPTAGTVLCSAAAECRKGGAGTQGGAFGSVSADPGGDVAVDPTSGNVYVTDPGNARVQELASNGSFLRAFGFNVVSFGPRNAGTAELQSVTVPSDSGTFSLSFDSATTGASATGTLTASSKQVTALSSAAGFVVGEVIAGEGIPAGTTITAVGADTLEISNAATVTESGVALTAGLAATASATQVEAALNALATIGGAHGNVTVSGGPGDAAGSSPYLISFGGSLLGENVPQVSADSAGLATPAGAELSCKGGPTTTTLTYQWLANGAPIADATEAAYTVQAADAGKAIQCRVLASGEEGAAADSSVASSSAEAPVAVASPYPAIAPPDPGTPKVTGSAEAGKQLVCAPGTWSGNPAFSYQWLRNGAPLGAANGAQSDEYEVQAADLGAAIQCEVTGSNLAAGGGAALADSDAVIALAAPPANAGTTAAAPAVSGTAAVGETLSCSTGAWSGASAFSYQWLSGGAPATGAGANTSSYTVAAADAGKAVQCVVTAENAEGKAEAASINKVVSPSPSPLPPARPSTEIRVTPATREVGRRLTCSHGTWSNSSGIEYSYTWLRNGAPIAGSAEGPQAGNGFYEPTEEDAGSSIQCQILATTASGSSLALSAAGEVISPAIRDATARHSGSPLIEEETVSPGAPAFEVCTLAEGCQKGDSGREVGQFGGGQPTRLTVDSSGDVYTVQTANPFRIERFAPAGASLSPEAFGGEELEGTTASFRNANAPIDIAFDPAAGGLLVAKAFPEGATPACPTGLESVAAERRVLEVSLAGSVLETGLACSWLSVGAADGITSLNGIAAGLGGKVLVSSEDPEQRVYVLDQAGASPPPAATIEAATAVGPREATLNADVTSACPAPLATGYHFEYRKAEEGAAWASAPGADAPLTAAGHASRAISGLEANQEYAFRLALNCQYGSASVASAEGSFTTGALPIEEAATLEPWPVGDAFATLRGELNPNNTEAKWRFQYVDDAAYQADQPDGFEHAQETPVGTATGGAVEEVSLEATGLEPATVYHYRLVAENGLGPEAVAAERSFNTFREPAAALQGPRAYELVTSADKHGLDAMISPLINSNKNGLVVPGAVPAPGGGSLIWSDWGAAPNPVPTGGIANLYRSNRIPGSGWQVEALSSPAIEAAASTADSETELGGASEDLSRLVVKGKLANLQTGEVTAANPFLLEAGAPPAPLPPVRVFFLSRDGSHVFFVSGDHSLSAEDTTNPSSGAEQLYEWSRAGGSKLAGVDSAGHPLSPCGALLGGLFSHIQPGGAYTGAESISEDGSRVFFSAPDPAVGPASQLFECRFGSSSAAVPTRAYVSDVYLREDASTTVNISRPPAGIPDFGAEFVGMDPSGSVAFLVSGSALTSDDPASGEGHADLYRYESSRHADESQKLTVAGSAGSFTVSMPSAVAIGTTANGSTAVTELEAASGELRVGDSISGGGIPAGTTIASIEPAAHELTLSQPAGNSGDGPNRVLTASEATGALAFDVPASGGSGATASLENALNELPVIAAGGGSVSVTSSGSPSEPAGATYTIAFDGGPLAGSAQPLLAAAGSGGAAAAVEPAVAGGPLVRVSAAAAGGEGDAAVSPPFGIGGSAIVSRDGNVVYFTARGQLIPGAGKTSAENLASGPSAARTRNLYRWSQDQGLRYVANIKDASDQPTTGVPLRTAATQSPLSPDVAAVNPDGSDLVFSSVSELSAYDSRETTMIYRYDAPSGEISCVSCSPTGIPIEGNVNAAGGAGRNPQLHTNYAAVADHYPLGAARYGGLSADGSTVFFASTDQLLPAATNVAGPQKGSFNAIYNVYMWRAGRLSLVSTGRSVSSDYLLGASASGREVFFLTGSQLLPSDHDHAYDIYGYTVDGGFPEASAPPPCDPLAATGCQGSPPQAPLTSADSSAAFRGPATTQPKQGRLHPRKHHKKKRHKKKHHQRKRHGKKHHAPHRAGRRHARNAHANRRAAK